VEAFHETLPKRLLNEITTASSSEDNLTCERNYVCFNRNEYGDENGTYHLNAYAQLTSTAKPILTTANLFKMKILKSSLVFSNVACPYGMGYYSMNDTKCLQFKICESFDDKFSTVSVYQCPEGMMFSFLKFKCVKHSNFNCQEFIKTEYVSFLDD
jgi:hypothetical protein